MSTPDLREVAVPVATVWTRPDAPRDLDAAATADRPDMASWLATLDAEGTADRRLGLHGRTLTQLLLGEPVRVLEAQDGWTRVAAPWQDSSGDERGYTGWVRAAHLGRPVGRTTGPTARVTVPAVTAVRDDGVELGLSCGTLLWLDRDGGAGAEVQVALPDGHTARLSSDGVALGDAHGRPAWTPDALLATARQFLGVRYLWGGTSGWGLDCSGLVHLTLRAHRDRVPRDACDQVASPRVRPVDLGAVEPGDLYFFARPGERVYHVGFVSRPVEGDGTRWMLHAPEGGAAAIEDAPLAPHRAETLVSAGRVQGPSVVE
jgi:gamma-D-glutamyl-L-lysine dipeptidyl-peptidase